MGLFGFNNIAKWVKSILPFYLFIFLPLLAHAQYNNSGMWY